MTRWEHTRQYYQEISGKCQDSWYKEYQNVRIKQSKPMYRSLIIQANTYYKVRRTNKSYFSDIH